MSDLKVRFQFGFAIATVLLVTTISSVTHAAAIACRSDPLVLLSDGTILDLSADIGANLWDVTSVTYKIRVPVGANAILAVSTPNWPTTLERFTIVSDQPRGVYDTRTTVATQQTSRVTANLIVGLQMAAKSGSSGEALRVTIRR